MDKTLIIFAHPDLEHSILSKQLIKTYSKSEQIHFTDLYEEYPDYSLLMFREVRSLLSHKKIIFHFPLVWYGLPAMLKLWLDEIMEINFKTGGRLSKRLEEKKINLIVTIESKYVSDKASDFEWDAEKYLQPLMKFIQINKLILENTFTFKENDENQTLDFETRFTEIKNIIHA